LKDARKFLCAGLVIVLIISVSGCSAKLKKSNSNLKQNTSKTSLQKIRVALWDYDLVGYDKKLIQAFSKKYPNIHVEVTSIPASNYENKIKMMLTRRENIDVIYLRSSNLFYSLILNNNIRPLDDLITRDKIKFKPYRNVSKANGKTYGIPYRTDFTVLYYNKDIFDKAKVPYPTNDMTWEEYRTLGKKLTFGKGYSKTYGILLNPFVMTYSVPKTGEKDKFNYLSGDFNLLKPGLKLLMDIQQADKSAVDYATNRSINEDQLVFEKGRTAMFVNGTWFTNYLVKDKKLGKFNFNWGIVKYPHWKGQKGLNGIANTPVCINAKTKKLDAAWTFVKFITSKEGAKILAKEMILPGYIDNDIMAEFNKNPDFPKGSENAIEIKKSYSAQNSSIQENLVVNVVQDEMENILTKNKSINQGISDMIKRRQEIINSNK
jgi:multiple sugar transport system substrate-binding protein